MKLHDLELARLGNQVTVQWRGSPKFFIGVLSTLTDSQAFTKVASSLEAGGVRPGTSGDQIEACVTEIRRRVTDLEILPTP